MKGIISQTIDWIRHPQFAEGTPGEWAAGALLILILSFMWTLVLKQIKEV